MNRAFIGATNALCAIGGGSEQVWASARAGIARIASSHVMNRRGDAIQMGLVPEEQLPPLPSTLEQLGLPSRARRMLRLAAPVLVGVTQTLTQPVKLFIGLPELEPEAAPWLEGFLGHLTQASNVKIDIDNSLIIPRGRASALLALESAMQFLASDPSAPVVVGGVDSYLDLRLLANLDAEQRVLGPDVMDGFIPGEGAAFFVLHAANDVSAPRIAVAGAASVDDSGHRYGSEPAKGEGLANAMQQLRANLPQPVAPIATTFAGFNGENFDAKLWGVAQLRHTDFFAPSALLEHPADKYGDTGAATGALLTAMAVTALSRNQRLGPALVWAASDTQSRACAVLSRA